MKTVVIRRRELSTTLPKEVLADSIQIIGSEFQMRQTKKGITPEEEVKYMPQVVGMEPTDIKFKEEVNNYFRNMAIKVPYAGQTLDITLDDAGNPVNVEDWLRYKYCLACSYVANTKKEFEGDFRKKFWIDDPSAEQEEQNRKVKQNLKADVAFAKVVNDESKLNWIIRLLSSDTNPDKMGSIEEKQNLAARLKVINPVRFAEVAEDKDLEIKAEIEEMVAKGVLRKVGNRYLYLEEVIGEELLDVLAYFKDKSKSQTVLVMKSKLKAINGK